MRIHNYFYNNNAKIIETRTKDQVLMEELATLANNKLWGRMLEKGKELLEIQEPPIGPIELITYSLQQGGELEATLEMAMPAIKLFPKAWIFPFLAGHSFHRLGEFNKACEYLRLANSLCPNDKQTIKELIKALAVSEGMEIAASVYVEKKVCQLGDSAEAHLMPLLSIYDWAMRTGASIIDAGDLEEIPFVMPKFVEFPCKELGLIHQTSHMLLN